MILDHTLKLTHEDAKIFARQASRKVTTNDDNLITNRYISDNDLKDILLSRMNSENMHVYETRDEVAEWLDNDGQW